MSGKRQPTALVEAKGKKHMSKAEKAQREAAEVKPQKQVKSLTAPKWLPEEHKKEFGRISKALVELMGPIMIHLDAEQIAQYCILQAQWRSATEKLTAEMEAFHPDEKILRAWSGIQSKCFTQARAIAQDMGLTITARCQLVLPEPAEKEEGNAFADFFSGPQLVPDVMPDDEVRASHA